MSSASKRGACCRSWNCWAASSLRGSSRRRSACSSGTWTPFDDLRDTQVQLLTVGKMLRVFPAARPFQRSCCEREERLTRKTRRHIKKVPSRRLGKLIAACREDVGGAARRIARPEGAGWCCCGRWIAPSAGRGNCGRASTAKTPGPFIARAWRLRSSATWWRRWRSFLPAVTAERLAAMHHYQTMMGEIQDAEVLLRALDKFLRKQEIKPEAARRFRDGVVAPAAVVDPGLPGSGGSIARVLAVAREPGRCPPVPAGETPGKADHD